MFLGCCCPTKFAIDKCHRQPSELLIVGSWWQVLHLAPEHQWRGILTVSIKLSDERRYTEVWMAYSWHGNPSSVSDIVRSCYFHICALKHIRTYLSLDTAISGGVCIVATRLDYCNSLLYGTLNRNLDKLQRIQNLLARTEGNASWSDIVLKHPAFSP